MSRNGNSMIKSLLGFIVLGIIAYIIFLVAVLILYAIAIVLVCLLLGIVGYFFFQFIRHKLPPKDVYKSQRYLRLFLFGPKGLNEEEREWLKERLKSSEESAEGEIFVLPKLSKEKIATTSII